MPITPQYEEIAKNQSICSVSCLIVEWVLTAQSWFSTDVIGKSFKSCALNLIFDGSENSKIHCFKKGQPCEAGADQLEAQLSVLNEANLPNPFPFEEANDDNRMTLNEDYDIDIKI